MKSIIQKKCFVTLVSLGCGMLFGYYFLLKSVLDEEKSIDTRDYAYSTSKSNAATLTESESKEYVVNTPRCRIVKLDPLHPTVKGLYKRLSDLNCSSASFIILENNTLRINKPNLSTGVNCFVQEIIRKNENTSILKHRSRIDIESVIVPEEFAKVECKVGSNVIYRQFYPFVFHKEVVEKRIQAYRQKQTARKLEQFNIIMLGLDSVSKNQFLRHMLRTQDFIKQNLTHAEMFGYNKIGKNTYANIVPMFTGKLEYEVPDTFAVPTNVIPFIWNEFTENGYRTQFSEDLPEGSIFNYGRKGFTAQPMDYYLRPWSLAVEPFIKSWKRGCLEERLESNVILKYMEDFMDLFPNDPLFIFTFLTRLSHDYLNELQYHDKPVRDFLERLYLKGHLNNTIIFFFGDHGFRFGEIRSTYVGRMEGRLPLMFVIVPPWFPAKYPQMYKNLKTNERRLTTPLDIYATLKDLLYFTGEGSKEEGEGRSVSLLKHPITTNRSCKEAAIKNQWCACVTSEPVSLDDSRIKRSALEIVKKINSITLQHRTKCAELKLASILSASKQDVGLGEDLERDGHMNFLITLKVSPSDGIFEGSVWFDGTSYAADNTIERINLYGNQSVCIAENVQKPYCYCVI